MGLCIRLIVCKSIRTFDDTPKTLTFFFAVTKFDSIQKTFTSTLFRWSKSLAKSWRPICILVETDSWPETGFHLFFFLLSQIFVDSWQWLWSICRHISIAMGILDDLCVATTSQAAPNATIPKLCKISDDQTYTNKPKRNEMTNCWPKIRRYCYEGSASASEKPVSVFIKCEWPNDDIGMSEFSATVPWDHSSSQIWLCFSVFSNIKRVDLRRSQNASVEFY